MGSIDGSASCELHGKLGLVAEAALETGVLPSMFSPVTRALPMVSVQDIGRVAAELLMAGPDAEPLVELHGPRDYSPETPPMRCPA